MLIYEVVLSTRAKKDLKKVPRHIAVKLQLWVDDVEERGLQEVRKVPGYHDEPLRGERAGERSIRLSLSYRAIYTEQFDEVEFVRIEEVNKHEY
ncbi:MAG: type II toxin-antitoxin system mRNA interferase toxin, RelE/StbE family [Myxococcaceae bacterium]